MCTYTPLLLYCCLLLVACSSDPTPDVMVPGKDYVLTEGRPMGLYRSNGNYSGIRLRIERDTAHLSSPFQGYTERLPAYAGDSLATFGDPYYMVYELQPDSNLVAVLRDSTGIIGRQRYELTDALETFPLAESVTGKTYRFSIDGQPYYAYFSPDAAAGKAPESRVNLYTVDDSTGRIDRVASGIGNRKQYHSIPVYFPYRPNVTGGRRGVLLFSGTETGSPQVHMNYDGADYNYLRGPYDLIERPSPLPADVGTAELADLLNRSNVSTHLITPEPADKEDLRYAEANDFWRFGGIEAAEAGALDFEFREDGHYAMFSGERVLAQGSWSLSPDRNFFILTDASTQHARLQFIDGYDGQQVTLNVPVRVKTREPRGTQLQSYYDAIAEVNFSR